MAKRKKKLNKKLVAALSAVTILVLLAIGAGVYKLRHRLFPKDPIPHHTSGMAFLEKKDYKSAVKELTTAVGAAYGKDAESRKLQAKYCYDLGQAYLDWFKSDDDITLAKRRECLMRSLAYMRQACTLDRDFVAPREVLYDLQWQMAYGSVMTRQASIDWTGFLESADALLALDPDNAVIYYRCGVAWGSTANQTADSAAGKKGLESFRKAIELDEGNIRYWGAWLTLLNWSASSDAKIDVDAGYMEAFKENPKSAALRIMYASYLRRKDRSDEAEGQLREAIQSEPESPSGHLAMASYLTRTEQYDAAEKALQAAEKIDPTIAQIYLQRSGLKRRGGKPGEALKALQAGVAALEPKLTSIAATRPKDNVTRRLTEQMNSLNFSLANTALDYRRSVKEKDKQDALAKLASDCLKKLENLPENSPHQAKIKGRLAFIQGDNITAIEYLEKAYKAFKLADLQTPALLITLYDKVGRPGKSEDLLLALRNSPRLQDSPEVMLGLANLRMRYQDYEGAENYVNRVLNADPKNVAALQMQRELQLLTGKTDPSATSGVLSRAGVNAMIRQIDTKWGEGQRDEAMVMLTNLRKAMPENLLLAEREINMQMLLGKPDAAKAILSAMLKLHPDNENMKFQREMIGKTPEQRLAMQLERIDKAGADAEPFTLAWTKAHVAARGGNKELYEKFLAEAIKLKPDDPNVITLQFRRAVRGKLWDKALAVTQRMEKIDETRGKMMQSQLFLRQGQFPKAIAVLVPLRKKHPNSKFVLHTLGECYLQAKQVEQAKDVFEALESNDPGDVSALIGLAMVAQHEGRMDESEKFVLRAHKYPAGRANRYINARYLEIAESRSVGDDIKDIIAKREKIHKQGPKAPNYLDNLARLARLCEYRTRDLARAGQLYRDAYEQTGRSMQWGRNLAYFYARNGDYAKGEGILKAGVNTAKSKSAKVAWLIMHGKFLSRNDPKQAMGAFEQASAIEPQNPSPLHAKATLFAQVGDWPNAIQNMSAYLAKRGEDMSSRKILIQYRINGREYDKAEKELDAILAKNPTDAQGLLLKAVLFRSRGLPAKAVAVATQAIEKHPEFTTALSVRASAYVIMGELELALNDLEAARTISKTPQIAMELADVYMKLGRESDAILVLKSVVAEHQTYENAEYKLINAYLAAKDWSNAERQLASAQARFPKQPAFLLMEAHMWQMREQNTKAVPVLAKAVALRRNLHTARVHLLGLMLAKEYDKALTAANDYKTQKGWGVWVDACIGRILVAQKQDAKAKEIFQTTVKNATSGEMAFVVSQLSEAYGTKDAIERMTAWSKARPTDWYFKILIGDLCGVLVNDPDVTITDAERAKYLNLARDSFLGAINKTKKTSEIAMLSNRLGKVYYDLGLPRDAEKAYKKCLEFTPNDNAALNNLAYLYVDDLNEPEKALPYVQKVIRLRPQDPNVLDTYGWVMGKLKRYAEAKKYLQRSIERDPELAACRFHLGWIFEQTGDRKQAIKHYRLGLELVRNMTHLPLHKRFQGALKRLGV
ncbi:MAG: tetratricopeptide repeat protein [Phycisphaerales bacterium]|jgi:tetratricopeptide (TPR) repeat protein|nr:tetratricopeptide repeat protein [Phycisphaerales bacterium]